MSSSAAEILLAEGKTKQILAYPGDDDLCVVRSKDDLTAGDGKKHDIIDGKAILANETACNVFNLLKSCGVDLAFRGQIDERSFLAERCQMIKLEVVGRREAHGSFLKRHPYLQKGHVFPKLVLEFFLKTSGKVWGEHQLVCDDPLIHFGSCTMDLYDAASWLHGSKPFLPGLPIPEEFGDREFRAKIGDTTKFVFLVLEKAWQLLGRRLVDFKIEFGINQKGKLRLADVIDNDSWRVVEDGQYIDKQVYRDGGGLNEVTTKYQLVRDLTGRFTLPNQRVIVWAGSTKDNLEYFEQAIKSFESAGCGLMFHARSAHKEPVVAYQELMKIVQDYPDSVIIAYVGRSNGLGPMLSANSPVPVITVPESFKDFPDDIWSSLRMPSDVPVMTVLRENAVPAALRILAMRNPPLYAKLRLAQEERMSNVVEITA